MSGRRSTRRDSADSPLFARNRARDIPFSRARPGSTKREPMMNGTPRRMSGSAVAMAAGLNWAPSPWISMT